MQGLGNVGYNAAQFCQHGGAIIIALAEYEGAIYNPKGLDVEAVMKHRKETGSLLNFPGATNLSTREEALELDCDILIPAALENQITEENAGRVKAKILAEAANGPTTAGAAEILLQQRRSGHPRHLFERRRSHRLIFRVAEKSVARSIRQDGQAV